MKLLTAEIIKKIPPLYSQEKIADPMVYVKFFTPWTNWTWYATEYDPKEGLFFGLVVGQETELGYFSIHELESVHGPGGLRIERDSSFRPTRLSELREKHRNPSHGNPFDAPERTVLKNILENIKKTHWVPGYKATDEQAMGVLMAFYFNWNGQAILRATYEGLEDSNYHTVNKTILKLLGGKAR